MRYADFIERVCDLGHFRSVQEAREFVGATAETLSDRLPKDEVESLRIALPAELAVHFKQNRLHEEEFPIEVFFERISEKTGRSPAESVRRVRAVAEVIQEAVPGEVMARIYQTLPYELRQLFDAGPPLQESRS